MRAPTADLDTDIHCPSFADPAYVLTCEARESVVARRYRSDCCGAGLTVE